MPVPLVPLIAAAAGALASFFAGRASKRRPANEERADDEALKAVQLAILGAERVGKSVLHKAIMKQTMTKRLSVSRDVGGSPSSYDEWETVVRDADAVLYLLKATDLVSEGTPSSDRIKRDVRLIVGWLIGRGSEESRYPVFVIVTHCDSAFPDFSNTTAREHCRKGIDRHDLVTWIRMSCKGKGIGMRMVIGGLGTADLAGQVVGDLYGAIFESGSA